jgi:transcriptional antiterminator RfaH
LMGQVAKHWYLVYAKPRQEAVARTNLARQGYQTYLPLVRQTSKRQGRRVSVVGPMFPRYLFIYLYEQSDNWGPIRSTLGVVSLVRFGAHAAQVPEGLVAMLKQREDEEGVQVMPTEEYRPGTKVRITEGSFAGYEGVLLGKSGRDRVVLLLEILGKYTRTVVGIGTIERGD